MANNKVMFKMGPQANINALFNGGATNGTFYLTDDTNRLYIGKNGKAVAVNQGVIQVESVTELNSTEAEMGQFYYVKDTNILCVRSGGKWVQINPDTDTKITARTNSVKTDNGFIVVEDVVTQTDSNKLDTDFKTNFGVKGTNGITVSLDETSTTPRLVITQANYALTSSADEGKATIALSNGVANSSVVFEKGKNVTLSKNDSGNIVIAAEDTTLADNGLTASIAADAANGAKLDLSVADTSGKTLTASASFGVVYGDNGGKGVSATFENGAFKLNTYTKAEVDGLIKGIDGMTYMGAVEDYPSGSEIRKGYTYKASKPFGEGAKAVKTGDVIIANGTEGDNGFITGTITWDIIPAGDDSLTDTTYTFANEGAGVSIYQDADVPVLKGGFKVASGNDHLVVSNEVKAGINEIKVTHAEPLATEGETVKAAEEKLIQGQGADFKFSIPVLSYDKAGHISAVTSQEFTVKDTLATYSLDSLKASVANNTATVAIAMHHDQVVGNNLAASFNIKSSTLTMSADANGDLTMDLEWGSF